MTTTGSLVTIHYYIITIFFLVMKTLKTYLLSDFQIRDTVLLAPVTLLYVTSVTDWCSSWSLYLLTSFTHVAPEDSSKKKFQKWKKNFQGVYENDSLSSLLISVVTEGNFTPRHRFPETRWCSTPSRVGNPFNMASEILNDLSLLFLTEQLSQTSFNRNMQFLDIEGFKLFFSIFVHLCNKRFYISQYTGKNGSITNVFISC